MTEAEEKLWHELRGRRLDKIKFRRQVPIGPYVADFTCLEARLIVEVDGSQHADSIHDEMRAKELKSRGFRVLRADPPSPTRGEGRAAWIALQIGSIEHGADARSDRGIQRCSQI